MSDWIPVIGTLLGTSLGAGATLLSQRLQERRTRAAALHDARRGVYTNFLTCMHGLFLEVRAVRLQAKTRETALGLEEELRRIQPLNAQQGLDEVRLIGTQRTAAAAEAVFLHLRGANAQAIRRGSQWREWHGRYRQLRKAFLEVARADLTGRHSDSDQVGIA